MELSNTAERSACCLFNGQLESMYENMIFFNEWFQMMADARCVDIDMVHWEDCTMICYHTFLHTWNVSSYKIVSIRYSILCNFPSSDCERLLSFRSEINVLPYQGMISLRKAWVSGDSVFFLGQFGFDKRLFAWVRPWSPQVTWSKNFAMEKLLEGF